jgi:hypothetical protein
MRENRPSGSEGGGTTVLPTPISGGRAANPLHRAHSLASRSSDLSAFISSSNVVQDLNGRLVNLSFQAVNGAPNRFQLRTVVG